MQDKPLLELLDAKLAKEVPGGSLVIDYSPRLGETQPEAFETLATVPMATSWASDQPFSIFRKKGGGPTGGGGGGDGAVCCMAAGGVAALAAAASMLMK